MSKENILLLLDTARKNLYTSQVEIEKLYEEINKKDKIIKEAAHHLNQHLITNRSNYILSWISEGEKALTILKQSGNE